MQCVVCVCVCQKDHFAYRTHATGSHGGNTRCVCFCTQTPVTQSAVTHQSLTVASEGKNEREKKHVCLWCLFPVGGKQREPGTEHRFSDLSRTWVVNVVTLLDDSLQTNWGVGSCKAVVMEAKGGNSRSLSVSSSDCFLFIYFLQCVNFTITFLSHGESNC